MGRKVIDLTGQKFGRWTVIERAGSNAFNNLAWLCKCECGKESTVLGGPLRYGRSRSCGCLQSQLASQLAIARERKITHGKRKSLEYSSWQHMKTRCYTPKTEQYKNYGGRGITVCDRWLHSFENFYADMGDRPSKQHSIDRIDVNGNYEPSNCKWSTQSEQNSNRRSYKRKKPAHP